MSSAAFMRWKLPERFLQTPHPSEGGADGTPSLRRAVQRPPGSDRRSWEAKPTRSGALVTASWPPHQTENKKILDMALTKNILQADHGALEAKGSRSEAAGLVESRRRTNISSHRSPIHSQRALNVETKDEKHNKGETGAACQQSTQPQHQAPAVQLPPLTPVQKKSIKLQKHPRHLRLLTPGTRANKTLYQTWHGRPIYHDYHTSYRWSMFANARRGHAQEYLIHPDWN
ncbi:uncharacterized protein LOC144772709 [Lissotriton helveticus]